VSRRSALAAAFVVAALGLAPARAAHAAPPAVDARAYIVADAATGDVLAARNADARVPIASITKLMTVLVALKHLRPDETVTVTPHAAQGRADPECERRSRRARGRGRRR
jgi:D-alanyl-D-alanine carboxypeptidase